MSFVEDRWTREVTGPDGKTRKERMPRYGKGLRYRARYHDPDGRERSRSFPDGRKREAEAFCQAADTDVRRGSWINPDGGRTTLRAFVQDTYLPALTQNITTQERIRSQLNAHILPKLGGRTLGHLAAHPSVIRAWLKGLPLAESSKKVMLQTLSGILTAAADDGLIHRNPCQTRAVPTPAPPGRLLVPWTAERTSAVQSALDKRFRAMVDCGAGLGMRYSEVLGFSPDDVGWLTGTVRVRRQLKIAGGRPVFAPPKGGRDRDIPLAESVKLRLAAHARDFPPVRVTLPWEHPEGKLVTVSLMFSSATGRAMRRAVFDPHQWIPARESAGVPEGRENGFHALRHRFASVLLAGGTDIRQLSEYMGHHDPAVTLRIYCHLMPDAGVRMKQIMDEVLDGDGPGTAQGAESQA